MNIEIYGLSLPKAREMRAKVREILKAVGLKNDDAITTIHPETETEDLSGRLSPYFRLVDTRPLNSSCPEMNVEINVAKELNKLMDVEILHIDKYIPKGREAIS